MLKAEWLQLKDQVFVADAPLLGQVEKLPLAAATFAAVDSVFTFSAREIMLPLTSSP